jgi:hypothetical protein
MVLPIVTTHAGLRSLVAGTPVPIHSAWASDDRGTHRPVPSPTVDRQARPPAYAWDWFSRQRLLWRRIRSELATGPHPSASRYRTAETRSDVLAVLRSDYVRDEHVRATVHRVLGEIVFLGRTDVAFDRLGVRTAPRGMRWWWTALTGERVDRPVRPAPPPTEQLELPLGPERPPDLTEVHEGFGG